MLTRILIPLLLLFSSYCVSAQSVVQDIERLTMFQAIVTDTTKSKGNIKDAALDTIIATLAYYATAPDTALAKSLFEGPKLLAYIEKNKFLRSYLVDVNLFSPIHKHTVSTGFVYRNASFLERSKFLKTPDPVGLFSDSGPFDLNFAREQAQIPAPKLSSLTAAATASSNRVSSENYVSSAIIGLTDFIAQRAQEELNYTFLTHLRDDLCKNNLNHLFPNTYHFLPGLDLLNYKSILPSIRQAFTKDLNQLSFNLGNYLGATSKNGYADPQLANILLIYQVLELGIREVSIADILGFTVSRLASNGAGLQAAINFKLSDTTAVSNLERDTIIQALDSLGENIFNLAEAAGNAKKEVLSLKNKLRGPIKKLKEADSKEADSLDFRFKKLFGAEYEKAELNFDRRWAKNAGDNGEALGILKKWLNGEEAVKYYQANPSLAYFDRLFSGDAKKSTPQELTAAGLIGVRGLLAKRKMLKFYYSFEDTLVKYAAEYREISQELKERDEGYSPKQVGSELRARIKKEKSAVKKAGKDTLSYDLLNRLIGTSLLQQGLDSDPENLPDSTQNAKIKQQTRAALAPIEKRFLLQVAKDSLADSPEVDRREILDNANKLTIQFPKFHEAIDQVNADFDHLDEVMGQANKKSADTLSRALGNIHTYASIFGMSQQLFFLLHRDKQTTDAFDYEKTEAIAPLLLDGHQSMLLRGITYQRLTQVPEFGNIDPRQLGSLVLDFSTILNQLHQPFSEAEILQPKVSRRIRTVEFVTEATKTILQAPVLTVPGIDTAFSLSQHVEAFANVPELSAQFNELFKLSQTGKYRYAVTNLLEIIKLFDQPTATGRKSLRRKRIKLADMETKLLTAPNGGTTLKKQISKTKVVIKTLEKRDSIRMNNSFFTYATFMADVAAADNSEAFVAALRSVALPKGSSAFKRNNNASLEISAMAGLSFSRETLTRPNGLQGADFKENAFVAAVFMPVGLMYSNKLRSVGKQSQKGTFSVFTSILDLGAVASFRFGQQDSPVQALPELKLSNVIAPGVHLLYQWPKSPFATGVGIQNGPNVRRYDPGTGAATQDLRAYRIMFSASIDVPIFRLWGSN